MIKVIDVHVHYAMLKFGTPHYCRRLTEMAKGARFNVRNEHVEIEKIILVPSYPCHTEICGDAFYDDIRIIKENPDLFATWGEVDPNYCEDPIKELGRQYDLGIVGIKLHPVHKWFKPNAYREEEGGNIKLLRIYEFAEDHNLPILVHTGTSIGEGARNKYGDPILLDDVLKDFPRITLIIAHAGRPIWYQTAFYLARMFSNTYLEISSIPPKNLLNVLPRLMEIEDKVIYGSDFPSYVEQDLAEYAEEAYRVTKSEKIMRDNALRLIFRER